MGQYLNDRRGKPAKYLTNCKRHTWHEPDECFELEKNAHKHHPRWKLCMEWRCGATRVEVVKNISNHINRSNIKITSCRSTIINVALQSNQLSPQKYKVAEKWREKLANRVALKIPKMMWQLYIQELVGFTWRQRPLRKKLIILLLIFW